MRKLLTVGVLTVAAALVSSGRASAWSWGHTGPWPQTAAFPCINPPGWYTNTYSYAWQYPWFAYYNYSHGPYANWMAGGGYAWYKTCPPWHQTDLYGRPVTLPSPVPAKEKKDGKKPVDPKPEPGKITINLPADAKLLFNGVAATGAGESRIFATPALEPGQDYGYVLTAEVVRDGQVISVSERVVVRAGETSRVTLAPGVVTASVK